MYSLVRGRLPLMRGRNWPFGSATPGESVTSGMKLRPSSGSVDDLLLVHVQAHFAARGLQQRRRGGDIDGLRRLADFQLHIDAPSDRANRKVMPDWR